MKQWLLNLFFPAFCLNCSKEGSYLCEDCFSLIEILEDHYCPFCTNKGRACNKHDKHLQGLFAACSSQNYLARKLIRYSHRIKDLSQVFSLLIIAHFLNLNKEEILNRKDIVFVPVPGKKQFSPALEIAKHLSSSLNRPFLDILTKTKNHPQAEFLEEKKSLQNIFVCKKPELVKNKTAILVDAVFTNEDIMEECAKALQTETWGVVAIRNN